VLHGYVSHADVARELGRSRVLVLLSRSEAMARIGLEAMAQGTPIVVSAQTSLDVWLSDGGGAVVRDPTDADEVGETVGEVLRDWDAHSRRALEVARSWTWRNHAELLLHALA
jgi:glycosyltransferase involved in cell wall biosynthesis